MSQTNGTRAAKEKRKNLKKRKTNPDIAQIERQMCDDLQWALQDAEVQKHVGKLVVVHKKEILAVGNDRRKLLEKVEGKEHPRDQLVVVEVLSDVAEVPPDLMDSLVKMEG